MIFQTSCSCPSADSSSTPTTEKRVDLLFIDETFQEASSSKVQHRTRFLRHVSLSIHREGRPFGSPEPKGRSSRFRLERSCNAETRSGCRPVGVRRSGLLLLRLRRRAGGRWTVQFPFRMQRGGLLRPCGAFEPERVAALRLCVPRLLEPRKWFVRPPARNPHP